MFVAPGTMPFGYRLTRDAAQEIARNWWVLLLNGALLIVAGFLIFSIDWTIRSLATFMGVLFIVQGVAEALTSGIDARVRRANVLTGLLSIATGAVVIIWPNAGPPRARDHPGRVADRDGHDRHHRSVRGPPDHLRLVAAAASRHRARSRSASWRSPTPARPSRRSSPSPGSGPSRSASMRIVLSFEIKRLPDEVDKLWDPRSAGDAERTGSPDDGRLARAGT